MYSDCMLVDVCSLCEFLIIVVFFIILCARLFKLVCARCLNFTYGRLGRCGCWVASECSRLRLCGFSRQMAMKVSLLFFLEEKKRKDSLLSEVLNYLADSNPFLL